MEVAATLPELSEWTLYRDGSLVLIAKSRKKICPFSILKRYLNMLGLPTSSEEFIFKGLTYMKRSRCYRLRKSNKPLSYTRMHIVFDAFERINLPRSKFGLHSLRAGGAKYCSSYFRCSRFKHHG